MLCNYHGTVHVMANVLGGLLIKAHLPNCLALGLLETHEKLLKAAIGLLIH